MFLVVILCFFCFLLFQQLFYLLMLGVMRYDRAVATDKHRVRYRGYAVSPTAFIVVVTQLRPRELKIFH